MKFIQNVCNNIKLNVFIVCVCMFAFFYRFQNVFDSNQKLELQWKTLHKDALNSVVISIDAVPNKLFRLNSETSVSIK